MNKSDIGIVIRNTKSRGGQIDAIIEKVEKLVYSTGEQEFSSRRIGEAVMDELKLLDEVAYVRFASVYRQFTDVSSFMEELNKLVLEGKARHQG